MTPFQDPQKDPKNDLFSQFLTVGCILVLKIIKINKKINKNNKKIKNYYKKYKKMSKKHEKSTFPETPKNRPKTGIYPGSRKSPKIDPKVKNQIMYIKNKPSNTKKQQ